MADNPFFSVIIPTYNPKEYIGTLLESITHNACLPEIEVIVSDDCSTEPFDEVLEQFPQISFVRICNDKHYGFPRTGRQHGATEARGKWICFADQDDFYLDNAFDHVKACIENEGMRNYIVTDFFEESVSTGKRIRRNCKSGWTHGKFYEKAFWDDVGLSYDWLKYCEDINLTTKVDCITVINKIKECVCGPVYVWRRRHDSLSDVEYFKRSMPDYIKATLGVIVEYIDKYVTNKDVIGILNVKFIVALLHVYFYYQSRTLNSSRQDLLKSIMVLQPIYTKFKWITGFKTQDILGFVNNDLIGIYNRTRAEDAIQIPFVEQITFGEWIRMYLD